MRDGDEAGAEGEIGEEGVGRCRRRGGGGRGIGSWGGEVEVRPGREESVELVARQNKRLRSGRERIFRVRDKERRVPSEQQTQTTSTSSDSLPSPPPSPCSDSSPSSYYR